MSRCTEIRGVLAVWDPTRDLPASVARHLDRCASCRAGFDRRWEPAPIVAPRVDDAVRRRLLGRRRLPMVVPLALAAAAAAAIGLAPLVESTAEASIELPPECPQEWVAPECPLT